MSLRRKGGGRRGRGVRSVGEWRDGARRGRRWKAF